MWVQLGIYFLFSIIVLNQIIILTVIEFGTFPLFDTGSNTNGGLYENIAKGQMVEEFDSFCFGGHKPGDTAIVYGSNGNYAGYHVMYFVGEGDLYSNVIAGNALRSEALNTWMTEITPEYRSGAFEWLAGK